MSIIKKIFNDFSLLRTNKNKSENAETEKDDSIYEYVQCKIDEARHLAYVTNTTIDENEFLSSFNGLVHILEELSKYEDRINFEPPPSRDLEHICSNYEKTIDLFKKRVRENEKNSFLQEAESFLEQPKANLIIPHNLMNNLDPLFIDTGKFIISTQKASISAIQRYCKIGFNRAVHIIDQLEECGIVGKENGTSPRAVLSDLESFEHLIKNYKGDFKPYHYISESDNAQEENIRKKVKMCNNDYDYMEGHDFEYFCADILRKNGFESVKVTPGSGDQGIDIIAIKDGVKYGIQCKCYSSDIGNKAVQEAFSGAKFYDCHVPAVITNRYFTKSANELAKKNGVLLWDRDKLNELIKYKERKL